MNADDVLVGDLPREQRLLLEAALERLSGLGVRERLRPYHLQRHDHAELLIPRLVDGAHASQSEEAHDVVSLAEVVAGHQRPMAAGAGGTGLADVRTGHLAELRVRQGFAGIVLQPRHRAAVSGADRLPVPPWERHRRNRSAMPAGRADLSCLQGLTAMWAGRQWDCRPAVAASACRGAFLSQPVTFFRRLRAQVPQPRRGLLLRQKIGHDSVRRNAVGQLAMERVAEVGVDFPFP